VSAPSQAARTGTPPVPSPRHATPYFPKSAPAPKPQADTNPGAAPPRPSPSPPSELPGPRRPSSSAASAAAGKQPRLRSPAPLLRFASASTRPRRQGVPRAPPSSLGRSSPSASPLVPGAWLLTRGAAPGSALSVPRALSSWGAFGGLAGGWFGGPLVVPGGVSGRLDLGSFGSVWIHPLGNFHFGLRSCSVCVARWGARGSRRDGR
jgi:hypothetical protein